GPWRPAGRSPPASSKAPAATWSRTGWASPEPAGACPEPRPSSGSAPSTPAATSTPTGTGTSSNNTRPTTSAATTTPSHSPPDVLTPKEPHPCGNHVVARVTADGSGGNGEEGGAGVPGE